MKQELLKYIKIFLVIVVVLSISYTIIQLLIKQEKEQLILGTWVSDNTPGLQYEFRNNGTVSHVLTGEFSEEYSYSLLSETTTSGLEIISLRLINSNQQTEIYEFEIIGLGEDKMILATTSQPISYMYYTKQ